MIVYELDFEFTMREGFPPAAIMTAYRKTGDEVIRMLDYLGRQYLTGIRLVTIEEI